LKGFERFVENMAAGSYPELVSQIKAHNKAIDDIQKAEEEQAIKLKKSAAGTKKRGSFTRKERLVRGSSKVFDSKLERQGSNIFLTGAAVNQQQQSQLRNQAEQTVLSEGSKAEQTQSALEMEPRAFTEIYPNPEDFSSMLKQIQEDCVSNMYQINCLDEDIRENNNAYTGVLNSLEAERNSLREDLNTLKSKQKSLQEQLGRKKNSVKRCEDPPEEMRPELTDEEIKLVFKMITQLAFEMDITDKKYKKPEDHTYAEIVEYIKDLTYLHAHLERLNEKARADDKKEYEHVVREIIRAKREKLRIEQEIKLAEEGRLKEEAKQKREADIKRKMKGRKGKPRVWLKKEDSGDQESSEVDPDAENKYWRMDDDYC